MAHPSFFRICFRALFALSLSVGWTTICFGQFETASVLGTVLDPRGGAIPHVNIVLQNLETGTSQTGTTDASGAYSFSDLQAGDRLDRSCEYKTGGQL